MRNKIFALIIISLLIIIFIFPKVKGCNNNFSREEYVDPSTVKLFFSSKANGISPNGYYFRINFEKYQFVSNSSSELIFNGSGTAYYHIEYFDYGNDEIIEEDKDYLIISNLGAGIYNVDMGFEGEEGLGACFTFDIKSTLLGDILAVLIILLVILVPLCFVLLFLHKIKKKPKEPPESNEK